LAQEGDALSAMQDAECMRQAVLRDNMERSLSKADTEAAYSQLMRRIEAKSSQKANTVTMAKWWMAIAATVCLAFIVSASLWQNSASDQALIANEAPQATTQLKTAPVQRKATGNTQVATVANTKNAGIGT